ncbi:type I-E CRISPR-associated protein Cas7/Cse4/CasC [Lysobacteraceae bacterium NML120232]|nr:type I-E CRISPR-associated protein Cas7/Cse4/CasC [Xanthomonadaceae bacterium NML120232]PJK10984.1 type I-E CRISPR-associated protein Cas7/Cse4/CasC [Xanthomonadaceae bacterium NML08-0793]
MSLFLEFHLIQNFAPSNLNRDDTGAPKDAIFGGQRRSRISSQCQKRAMRKHFRISGLLPESDLGIRTRLLDRVVKSELIDAGLEDCSKFNEIVKLALKNKEKEDKGGSEDDKSSVMSYLLFISFAESEALRELVRQHANLINKLAGKKGLKKSDMPADFKRDLEGVFMKGKAVDIALFGRMLTDMPKANQNASCQVAHAISTHRVEREFDYFTAVDERAEPHEAGAGHVDFSEFNSATFYRYAVLDAQKLLANLQDDKELTLSAIEAFAKAMALAIPSGKQNSFAAHNPPDFIGVSLRHAMPLNLANAFEKPVRPKTDASLTAQSVAALSRYEDKLATVYAAAEDQWLYLDLTGEWPENRGEKQQSLDGLARRVREWVAEHLGA